MPRSQRLGTLNALKVFWVVQDISNPLPDHSGNMNEIDAQNTGEVNSDAKIETHVSESDEYAKDPAGIRRRTETCQSLFEDCQQYPALSEGDWIDQMSAKFNWWSLGIGAGKSGHSSLDHRVRTRDDVRNILVSLLDSLTTSLRNCIKIGMLAFGLFPNSRADNNPQRKTSS